MLCKTKHHLTLKPAEYTSTENANAKKTGCKTLNTRSVPDDDDMDKQFGATDCHMYGH